MMDEKTRGTPIVVLLASSAVLVCIMIFVLIRLERPNDLVQKTTSTDEARKYVNGCVQLPNIPDEDVEAFDASIYYVIDTKYAVSKIVANYEVAGALIRYLADCYRDIEIPKEAIHKSESGCDYYISEDNDINKCILYFNKDGISYKIQISAEDGKVKSEIIEYILWQYIFDKGAKAG